MFLEERWKGSQKGDEVGNTGGGTEMCSGCLVKTTSQEGEASKSGWGKEGGWHFLWPQLRALPLPLLIHLTRVVTGFSWTF